MSKSTKPIDFYSKSFITDGDHEERTRQNLMVEILRHISNLVLIQNEIQENFRHLDNEFTRELKVSIISLEKMLKIIADGNGISNSERDNFMIFISNTMKKIVENEFFVNEMCK